MRTISVASSRSTWSIVSRSVWTCWLALSVPSMVSTAGIPASMNGTWSELKGFSDVWTASDVYVEAAVASVSIRAAETCAPSISTVRSGVLTVPIMSMLMTALVRARSAEPSASRWRRLPHSPSSSPPNSSSRRSWSARVRGQHAGDLEQPRAAAAVVVRAGRRCVGATVEVDRVQVGADDHQCAVAVALSGALGHDVGGLPARHRHRVEPHLVALGGETLGGPLRCRRERAAERVAGRKAREVRVRGGELVRRDLAHQRLESPHAGARCARTPLEHDLVRRQRRECVAAGALAAGVDLMSGGVDDEVAPLVDEDGHVGVVALEQPAELRHEHRLRGGARRTPGHTGGGRADHHVDVAESRPVSVRPWPLAGGRDFEPARVAHGSIGAASWIFNGVIGTPSLQRPLKRCRSVSPSAKRHARPE